MQPVDLRSGLRRSADSDRSGILRVQERCTWETLRVLYVGFNNAKKPFDDVRVRQAFNLATDRESIVKYIYQDLALVASNIVAPRTTGYFPIPPFEYNPAKAKALLAEDMPYLIPIASGMKCCWKAMCIAP